MPFPVACISGVKVEGVAAVPPTAVDPPVAGLIVTPTTGYVPLTVTIQDTSTGIIARRIYDMGNGETVERLDGATWKYVYDASIGDEYTITLTVSNLGGSDSAQQSVNVEAMPVAPTAAFTALPASGNSPLTVTFTNTSSGIITSYLWEFGDGTTSALEDPPARVYGVGSWLVRLTVTGPGGTHTATQDLTVAAVAPPPSTTVFPFSVKNDRTTAVAEVVTASVSFPVDSGPFDTATMRVETAAGVEIASGFKVLARWDGARNDGTKRISWVQAHFPATIPAGGRADYVLRIGVAPAVTGTLSVASSSLHITVNTGAASFRMSTTTFDLLNQVTVGSATVVNGAGSLYCALSDGARSPTNVSTAVEWSSTVAAVVRQTGRLGFDGADTNTGRALAYTCRWYFSTGSKRVLVRFTIENPNRAFNPTSIGSETGHDGRKYIDELTFSLALPPSSGTHTVRSKNAAFSTAAYSLVQKVRAQTTKTGDRRIVSTPTGYRYSTEHLVSYVEQGTTYAENEGSPTLLGTGLYPGGFGVKGSSGSVLVGVTRFAERCPSSLATDAATGRVRIGMFVPGSLYKGPSYRALSHDPWIGGTTPANALPAGINPATGLTYRANDFAPLGYPDRSVPPSAESKPSAPPAPLPGSGVTVQSPGGLWQWTGASGPWRFKWSPGLATSAEDELYYRIDGGRRMLHEFELSFEDATFTASADDVAAAAERANTLVIGSCTPSTYRTNRTVGIDYCERLTQAQLGSTHAGDFARYERWAQCLIDDASVDPATGVGGFGSNALMMGWPGWYRGGERSPNATMPPWGKWSWGDTAWGSAEGWSNLHYDPVQTWGLHFLRTGDPRFLNVLGRDHATWSFTQGHIHSGRYDATTDTVVPLDSYSGCGYWEKGYYHGTRPFYPGASHTWIRGRVLWYLITGDEFARESALWTAMFFTHPQSNRSPAHWSGQSGDRQCSRGIFALAHAHRIFGAHIGVGGRTFLAEAAAGIERYRRLESGLNLSTGAALPVDQRFNYVPAHALDSGVATDFSGLGFILATSGNPKWTTQTWETGHLSSAIAEYVWASRSTDAAVLALLKRNADYIMGADVGNPPTTLAQIKKTWVPSGLKGMAECFPSDGVTCILGSKVQAPTPFTGSYAGASIETNGNVLMLWPAIAHLSDAYQALRDTAHAAAAATFLARAKLYMRSGIRYHSVAGNYTSIPAGLSEFKVGTAQGYINAGTAGNPDWRPDPAAQFTQLNLEKYGAVSQTICKFIPDEMARNPLQLLAALRAAGEVGV